MKRLWLILLSATLWGQSHEILRPTVDVTSNSVLGTTCNTINVNSTAMPSAYDSGGLSTSSNQVLTVTASQQTAKYATRIFKTWASTTNTYTNLTLNVNSTSAGTTNLGDAFLLYSLNAGSTWNVIFSQVGSSGWAQQTSTFTLSTSQALGNIWIGLCVDAAGDGANGSTTNIQIFDIWTDGTYTPPTPTPTPAIPPQTPAIAHPVIISKASFSKRTIAAEMFQFMLNGFTELFWSVDGFRPKANHSFMQYRKGE